MGIFTIYKLHILIPLHITPQTARFPQMIITEATWDKRRTIVLMS